MHILCALVEHPQTHNPLLLLRVEPAHQLVRPPLASRQFCDFILEVFHKLSFLLLDLSQLRKLRFNVLNLLLLIGECLHCIVVLLL